MAASAEISQENFQARREREHAATGAITASLAWNDPSDLDLHAEVQLKDGDAVMISFRNKEAAGGVLDVDMHCNEGKVVDEPVENIHWAQPPAGEYNVLVHLYKRRGEAAAVPFKALLKRAGEEDLTLSGSLDAAVPVLEVFRFSVDEDGSVTMGPEGAVTRNFRPPLVRTPHRVPVSFRRRLLRDSIYGITTPALMRLARKGGVLQLGSVVREEMRGVLMSFLRAVICDAIVYVEHQRRKTLKLKDVQAALQRRRRPLRPSPAEVASVARRRVKGKRPAERPAEQKRIEEKIKGSALRRLSYRGGVKSMSDLVDDEMRAVLEDYVRTVLRDAVERTKKRKRKTLSCDDVCGALEARGRILYGPRLKGRLDCVH